jgi:thiol:disulfide interchange protein
LKASQRRRATAVLVGVLALAALAGCLENPTGPQATTTVERKRIDWVGLSFEQARARAAAEDKLVLVYAMAQWCPWSRRMNRETWADRSVVGWVSGHAIALRWDVEDTTVSMPIEGIHGVPTVVVFRGDTELARQLGYLSPMEFLAWLKSVPELGS